jgi:hypothetical protein
MTAIQSGVILKELADERRMTGQAAVTDTIVFGASVARA